MELVQQLKKDGIDKGLCRLWQMKLKQGLTYKDLIGLYIRGIDFCIKGDYPTLDFIREHFKGKCEPYGVFVDDDLEQSNLPNIVLNGKCRAFLDYDGYSVSNIYARDSTKCSVNISDYAIVTIDAFDNAELFVATSGDDAKVLINVYGNAKIECLGNGIKVNYKNKKTY
jgi:hypothetical protein|nr:MAG: hypothetical protein [Bacteriophage sp.]DAP58062.1 MAG TPA: hypothetical protein [Caudoviricetes sp.]